jgi:aryl-alcohol dehydrogenase-like predicted oxidoreductase
MSACWRSHRWRHRHSERQVPGRRIPEGSRRSQADLGGRWRPATEAATAAYLDVASKHGLDPSQMAIAFCISRPFMTSTIIGATRMDQLKTAIGAAEVSLSDAVFDDIAKARRAHPLPI